MAGLTYNPISPAIMQDPGLTGGFGLPAPGAGSTYTWANPTSPTYAPPPMPSLSDLLAGDPIYQQQFAQLQAGGVYDTSTANAARARALIQFGQMPDLSGVQGLIGDLSGLDPNTGTLAQQNTTAGLSTQARLSQANTDAIRRIKAVLGARGLFRSGETGYQLGREQTDYTRAQYDARQKLVDYLAGVQSALVQAERARQAALYQSQLNALMSWLSQHPDLGGGQTSGSPGGWTQTPTTAPAPDTEPSPSTGLAGAQGSYYGTPSGATTYSYPTGYRPF